MPAASGPTARPGRTAPCPWTTTTSRSTAASRSRPTSPPPASTLHQQRHADVRRLDHGPQRRRGPRQRHDHPPPAERHDGGRRSLRGLDPGQPRLHRLLEPDRRGRQEHIGRRQGLQRRHELVRRRMRPGGGKYPDRGEWAAATADGADSRMAWAASRTARSRPPRTPAAAAAPAASPTAPAARRRRHPDRGQRPRAVDGAITANGGAPPFNGSTATARRRHLHHLRQLRRLWPDRGERRRERERRRSGGGGRIAIAYDPLAQSNQNLVAKPTVVFAASDGRSQRTDIRSMPGTIWLTDSSFFPPASGSLFSGQIIIPGFTNWSPGSLSVTGYTAVLTGVTSPSPTTSP